MAVEDYNKVFGIGLSRTGTTSLHDYLEFLGFKSIHYVPEWIVNPISDLGYDAYIDTPIPALMKDLDHKFPKSKFILTTRNKEKWLLSVEWLFRHGKVIWDWPKEVLDYHEELYGIRNFDPIVYEKVFDQYHQQIQSYFKDRQDDLLVLNIDDGLDFEQINAFLAINKPPNLDQYAFHSNKRRTMSIFSRFVYFLRRELFNTYPKLKK